LNKSEFFIPDAQGAPDKFGRKYHAGKDWFAPGGSSVVAPAVGRIVEVHQAVNFSGQIFGGTVKVQMVNGHVWVFRHVVPHPGLHMGQRVDAGYQVATVARWADNPSSSHCHIEFWMTLAGGYTMENMRDPCQVLKGT
jgi:murein DD-endopeptidase MepM/ murein hydrolase activator NlpD